MWIFLPVHPYMLTWLHHRMQKEVADLRLALGIGRKNEEELARKSLAREKTLETLARNTQWTGCEGGEQGRVEERPGF